MRILLAESIPLYRQAIVDVLARIKGIELVDKVGTGWEAVRLSAQLKPGIILMDFDLPWPEWVGSYQINQATAD